MRVTLFSVVVLLFVVAVGYRQVKATAQKTGSDIRDVAGDPREGDGQRASVAGGPTAGPVGLLAGVAGTSGSGDLAAAARQARGLRKLAGEANAELLQMGLPGCLLRLSGMPL